MPAWARWRPIRRDSESGAGGSGARRAAAKNPRPRAAPHPFRARSRGLRARPGRPRQRAQSTGASRGSGPPVRSAKQPAGSCGPARPGPCTGPAGARHRRPGREFRAVATGVAVGPAGNSGPWPWPVRSCGAGPGRAHGARRGKRIARIRVAKRKRRRRRAGPVRADPREDCRLGVAHLSSAAETRRRVRPAARTRPAPPPRPKATTAAGSIYSVTVRGGGSTLLALRHACACGRTTHSLHRDF